MIVNAHVLRGDEVQLHRTKIVAKRSNLGLLLLQLPPSHGFAALKDLPLCQLPRSLLSVNQRVRIAGFGVLPGAKRAHCMEKYGYVKSNKAQANMLLEVGDFKHICGGAVLDEEDNIVGILLRRSPTQDGICLASNLLSGGMGRKWVEEMSSKFTV